MKFSRKWAMPNRWTFGIPPIRNLLARYIKAGDVWVDPFAGMKSPAQVRNDLNHEANAQYHMDAVEFAKNIEGVFDGVLFDPPYSPRQISECYKSIGRSVGIKETQSACLYKNVREAIIPKLKPGAMAISFGWSSVGFGKKLGFRIIEIMLVCHGGAHNDTIVTVECLRSEDDDGR